MVLTGSLLLLANIAASWLVSRYILNLRNNDIIKYFISNQIMLKERQQRKENRSRVYATTLKLINNSGVLSVINWLRPVHVFALCVFTGSAGFVFVINKIQTFISAVVIGLVCSCIPHMILDVLCRYNSDRIRNRLSDFISILSRWCNVREDILYAMDKAAESGIGEPIKTYVKETCLRVKSGMAIDDALDILIEKVDNTFFRDLIINIRQTVKSRGDIKGLLYRMENQYYKIKAELDRRKITTLKDRLLVYIMMVVFPLSGGWLIAINDTVAAFYLHNPAGKAILTIISLFYALGIFLTIKMSDSGVG